MRCFKKISLTFVAVLGLTCMPFAFPAPLKTPNISIVEPLKHPAMDAIIAGFKDGLERANIHANLTILNGQLDPTIELAIFKELAQGHADVIAPIGTTLFEMALASAPNKAVVGIAALLPKSQIATPRSRNTTAIDDAISPSAQLAFIREALPKLNQITLIYSADDNIIRQVKQVQLTARTMAIKIQPLMVTSSADLYTLAQHISPKSNAILVLKDHLVVSGIAALSLQARDLKIPLITSDEGSIQGGGCFAFGVSERQIGERAAQVVAQHLKGTPLSSIPLQTLSHYKVFFNAQHAQQQGLNLDALKNAADRADIPLVACTSSSCTAP